MTPVERRERRDPARVAHAKTRKLIRKLLGLGDDVLL
jgi:hypothetical protein